MYKQVFPGFVKLGEAPETIGKIRFKIFLHNCLHFNLTEIIFGEP